MNYLHSLQMLALTYQTFYYVKIFSIQYVTDIGTPFICFLRSCPQSTEMRVNTFKGFYQFFLLPLIVLCVFRSVPTSAYKCALIMMKIWAGSVYWLIKYIYDTLHSREMTNRFSFFCLYGYHYIFLGNKPFKSHVFFICTYQKKNFGYY